MKTTILCGIVAIGFLAPALLAPGAGGKPQPNPGSRAGTIDHDGLERQYRLYVPRSYDPLRPVPLVVVLHGGGGSARQIERSFGMNRVARREGFLVLYPQGIDGHWNDGRDSEVFALHHAGIDDVGFISALLDHVQAEYAVDRSLIFATGPSNGGMFSSRLGIEMADHFAAIAPLIGGIPKALAPGFAPDHPISVLIMQGTEDPGVLYEGGPVAPTAFLGLKQRKSRGHVIPTDEAVDLWKKNNGLNGDARLGAYPDKDKDDGVKAQTYLWSGGEGGSAVMLVKMVGAGHTVPGTRQYLPKRMIGATCNDFSAAEEIWTFFEEYAAER